jgi:Secretion system C-terminal sorting domain
VDHRTGSANGPVNVQLALGLQLTPTLAYNCLGSPIINTNAQDVDDPSDNTYYGFFPGTQPAYNMEMRKITTNAYVGAGNNNITGEIRNMGSQNITSMTMNYQINNGATISCLLTGLNIASFNTYAFTHTIPWSATLGTYTVTAYATNLNNGNADAVPSNDKLNKTIIILSKNVKRTPLLEVYTSSTCPPCKPGNEQLHSVIDLVTENKPCTIKFQQDFPGTGDPYCTTESVNRRGYYAINSIPRMEIDGGWDQNANSFTTALLNAAQASPAQFEMSGSYWLEGPSIHGEITYAPAFNSPAGTKLYVAVLENKTIKNVKTNGETEFTQVMKKMLPTENGTTLPAIANGVSTTTNFDYTFKGNYRLSADGAVANRIVHAIENSVEEVEDLTMVAWIQGADKTVYQALNLTNTPTGIKNVASTIEAVNIYPNPSNAELNINIKSNKAEEITILMLSTDGKIVFGNKKQLAAGLNNVKIETRDLSNGIYNIAIIDANNNSKTIQVVVAH